MQAVILRFPSESEIMAKPPASAPPSKAPWWPSVLAGLIGAVIATLAVGATLWVRFDTKFDALNASIAGLGTRIQKNEDAIKAISSQQSDQTQRLVHDLLASAESEADPKLSARSALAAASLVGAMRTVRTPAPPEFFQSSIEILNNMRLTPEVASAAFHAKVALADYRSAIVPLPNRTTLQFAASRDEACMSPDEDYPNHLTDASAKFDMVNLVSINNCWVGLDNVRWKNVAFVNMRIRYLGGDLDLENVIFVNCTFELTPSPKASNLLEYAALDQQKLSVGM